MNASSSSGVLLGLDIGLSGGLAAMRTDGSLIFASKLPLRKAQRGKSVIDVTVLRNWVPEGVLLAVMEDTHSFGHESRSSCFSFGRSTGRCEALFEMLGLPFEAVDPRVWKAEVLTHTKKDKLAALGYVHSRYPAWKERVGNQDGIADSICLAEFARRRIVGGGAG